MARAFKVPHPLLDRPLYSRGRFGRLSFAAWSLLLSLLFFICIVVLDYSISLIFSADLPPAIKLLYRLLILFLSLIYLYYLVIIMIRRLHDCNHSSCLLWLMIIPGLNLGLLCYLFSKKGDEALNRFGYPRLMYGWEKILGLSQIILLSVTGLFSLLYWLFPTDLAALLR